MTRTALTAQMLEMTQPPAPAPNDVMQRGG